MTATAIASGEMMSGEGSFQFQAIIARQLQPSQTRVVWREQELPTSPRTSEIIASHADDAGYDRDAVQQVEGVWSRYLQQSIVD
jgi:hypothetical protein